MRRRAVGAIGPGMFMAAMTLAAAGGCSRLNPGAATATPGAGAAAARQPVAAPTDGGLALATLVGQAAGAATPGAIPEDEAASGAERSGALPPGGIARFVFDGGAEQLAEVTVSSVDGTVVPALAGADGVQLKYPADSESSWSGQLPTTQPYYLTLVNTGTSDRAYGLRLRLAGGQATVAQEAMAQAEEGTALFPPGEGSVLLTVAAGALASPLAFSAAAGQVLVAAARASDGSTVTLSVVDPGGQSTVGPRPGSWRGPLPVDGTYQLWVTPADWAGALPQGITATLGARLLWPEPGQGVRELDPGSRNWQVGDEVTLEAGQMGGGSWRLPEGGPGALDVVLVEAPDEVSALVAVHCGGNGRTTLFDPALPRATLHVPELGGACVVTFLWSGGASGRTVRYAADLTSGD
jgi:hypothetical protein